MKIGDRFYTIAYTDNPRVIEVEIIGVETVDGEEFVHLQSINNILDKWYLKVNFMNNWKFPTRKIAEKRLMKLQCEGIEV